MAWFDTWFDISNTYGSVWSNGVGQNRETDEEHDKYCVEEGFQLARVKFDRHGEGDSEALGMSNCSINIWDGSEQEFAWFKKTVHILKTIFQCFYYLVFRIHQLLRCAMFYIK